MPVNLIVAINNNYSIGKDGVLIKRIQKDLDNFKKITMGHNIVMGRKSFEEIKKPLKNRNNIVLTKDKNYKVDGVTTCDSFKKLLEVYSNSDEKLFICGGQHVYEEAIPYVDKAYITFIDDDTEGDTKFPFEHIKQHFELVSGEYDSENGLDFAFAEYVRKWESHEQSSS